MYTQNQICQKIRSVYPDIGDCGIDLNVEYDKNNNAYKNCWYSKLMYIVPFTTTTALDLSDTKCNNSFYCNINMSHNQHQIANTH